MDANEMKEARLAGIEEETMRRADEQETIGALVAALDAVNADAGSLGLKDETWKAIDAALALAREGG